MFQCKHIFNHIYMSNISNIVTWTSTEVVVERATLTHQIYEL